MKKMVIAIPEKDVKFELMTEEDVYGGCYLDGKSLYVLYQRNAREQSFLYELKKYDLETFNGDEAGCKPIFSGKNLNTATVVESDGKLILKGGFNVILDKGGEQLLSEWKDSIPEDWKETPYCFVQKEVYLRQIDQDAPTLGIDVYDLNKMAVVRKLDCDIKQPQLIGRGLIAGVRVSDRFGVFSIDENSYQYHQDFEPLIKLNARQKVIFKSDNTRLVIAASSLIFIICLKTYRLLHIYDCLKFSEVQEFLKRNGSIESHFKISGISYHGGCIVAYGDSFCPYVMCIEDEPEVRPLRWLYSRSEEILAVYEGGDLVFGLENRVPVAWNIRNGDQIWRSNSRIVANKIQIGDGWAVYSQSTTTINCFRISSG